MIDNMIHYPLPKTPLEKEFTFTIDRATWRCGKDGPHQIGLGITKLLNAQGFRCCLGSLGCAIGFTDGDLEGVFTPLEMSNRISRYGTEGAYPVASEEFSINPFYYLFPWLNYIQLQRLYKDAMEMNDDVTVSQSFREERLIVIFRQYDINVTFTGEYATVNNQSVQLHTTPQDETPPPVSSNVPDAAPHSGDTSEGYGSA